jgi:hypothetical protein
MSQQSQEIDKLHPLEAAMVRNLRMTALQEREELLAISKIYAEMFPVRPVLRLVKDTMAEMPGGAL